jgi:LysM repeat protein
MKRLLTTTGLVLAMTFSTLCGTPLVQAAASQSSCPAYHTVQSGENLFRIGLKYGLSWTALASANGLANPNAISVGQVLCIPAVLPAATLGPTKTAAPTLTPTKTATPTATGTGVGGGAGPTATATPQPIVPTFFITGVVKDATVSISGINFPANRSFEVLMGAYGTLGVGGIKVGTQNSGTGSFTATYSIPASLKGSAQIAVRLQSTDGYFSYNWFYNNTK